MTTPLPILIMQMRPEEVTADSEFACILKVGGLEAGDTCRMRIERDGIPDDLDLDRYAAIIVGGSPFDISTPQDRKSAVQKKIEAGFDRLLAQVVRRDFPFLGACSGNGLLGAHLGARISGTFREPISLATLDITETGKADKLLCGLPAQFDVLVGHKEAVDEVPEGAVLLAAGRLCPVQMFRVGENVYATQFHPEADADEFFLRIETYRHHGYFEPREADALKRNISERPTPHAQEILRRFVAHYYRR